MAQSETIAAIATALCEAQFALRSAKKDSTNPHFRSRYADLTAVWDACREALHANGLSVVQAPEPCDIGIQLRSILLHKSGEWIDSTIIIPAAKVDAQGFGSAMSYARRYSLAALVGIVADEDDDGNAASQPVQQATDRTQGAVYQAQPTTNGSNGSLLASEKQIKMLFGLWNKGGFEGDLKTWVQKFYNCKIDDLTSKYASDAISTLQNAMNEQAPADN